MIRTFANHLESKGTEAIDGNYSRLSDELKMRLEFAESIDTYRVDESCHAHERNGSINSLFDAVKKLSFVLDKKRIECPEIEEFKETSLSASVERIFLSIDVELLSQAKELADVLIKLPVGSVKSSDIHPIFTEGKVSGACRCKRNMKVFPKVSIAFYVWYHLRRCSKKQTSGGNVECWIVSNFAEIKPFFLS